MDAVQPQPYAAGGDGTYGYPAGGRTTLDKGYEGTPALTDGVEADAEGKGEAMPLLW